MPFLFPEKSDLISGISADFGISRSFPSRIQLAFSEEGRDPTDFAGSFPRISRLITEIPPPHEEGEESGGTNFKARVSLFKNLKIGFLPSAFFAEGIRSVAEFDCKSGRF